MKRYDLSWQHNIIYASLDLPYTFKPSYVHSLHVCGMYYEHAAIEIDTTQKLLLQKLMFLSLQSEDISTLCFGPGTSVINVSPPPEELDFVRYLWCSKLFYDILDVRAAPFGSPDTHRAGSLDTE